MPLTPNRDVFITCALTGAGDTTSRSPHVPITPRQIADSAIEAARAGAAIAHIHVRDPETGAPARRLELYEETVELIRASGVDMVLNLTAGMGGDLTLGSPEAPLPPSEKGTDMAGATERLAHVAKLLPEICTLDCGTMNFGEGDYIMVNSPAMLKAMAAGIRDLGVRPEIEIFDGGHLVLAKWLQDQGIDRRSGDGAAVHGRALGRARRHRDLHGTGQQSAAGWTFSAFSIGRNQLPYAALAVLAGGNIRVGLEDNLWLGKGQLATNAQLVERAVQTAEGMGCRVIGPDEVREKLKLTKRW
jgi:uncharacterized protein (DUF849 family)